MESVTQLPKKILLKAIQSYQWWLSPWLGNQCRFYPSCSEYAKQAIEQYGVARGSFLMVKRLLKCHPWHPGGLDRVP